MAENTLPAPSGAIALPAQPSRFALPVGQVRSLFAQPAVRRSLPLIITVAMIGLAAMAWATLRTPSQRMLFQGLSDGDKAAMSDALSQAKITSRIDSGSGTLTVAEDDYYRARMVLAAQNLPKSDTGGYAILDQLPLGVSRAVEGERLRQARESELAKSIEEIDAVADARVHLAMPEQSVFVRDNAQPSASVVVRLNAGRSLADAQVRSIVNLVASSVPGMKPDGVTVVDQAGELLTAEGGGTGGGSAGQERIDFQRKLEDKYRQQLAELLTPLLGAGNFTAEVQAEVDLDETQATRESYDKDGVLRAEQNQWSGNQAAPAQSAMGIPGALSNTAPPPATAVPTQPQPAAAGQPPATAPQAAATSAALPPGAKQSDQFTRSYELGRQVSVTRAAPGAVKRLSVAVVIREAEGAKRRTPAELNQITGVVRAAMGINDTRGDQVQVISRPFAGAAAEEKGQPWYEAGWLPVVARNVTALIVAVLLILFGVKPLVAGLLKNRGRQAPEGESSEGEGGYASTPPSTGFAGLPGSSPAAQRSAAISLDMLDNARSYGDKVSLVREFTRENPARAALAVREMIKS